MQIVPSHAQCPLMAKLWVNCFFSPYFQSRLRGMPLFLRVLCDFSRFNDSFRGSHKVNVFKLTVIELLTYLSGLLKMCHIMPCSRSLIVIIYHSFFRLRGPALNSLPQAPLFYSELWASPWEVIYNAIGVTIIRLHTISLCPLCLGRLLWAAFLFPPEKTLSSHPQRTCKSI